MAPTSTIGGPIANTQLYVLDERDRIAPPGAFGTLFIGGDGLAKGYFDRPDLTARAFREIALAGRPPRRLYCTGDRGPPAALGRLRTARPQRPPGQAARLSHRARGDRERAAPDARCARLRGAAAPRHRSRNLRSWPMSCRPAAMPTGAAAPTWRGACPTTWCRRAGSSSMPCRSRRAASSTATRCRDPPEAPRPAATSRRAHRPRHSRPRSQPCGPRCSAATTSAWRIPLFSVGCRLAPCLPDRRAPAAPGNRGRRPGPHEEPDRRGAGAHGPGQAQRPARRQRQDRRLRSPTSGAARAGVACRHDGRPDRTTSRRRAPRPRAAGFPAR